MTIVKKIRKKKAEPEKFYILLDDYTGEFDVTKDIKSLQDEVASRLSDDPEVSQMRVFEAVEMNLEVEFAPQVNISSREG